MTRLSSLAILSAATLAFAAPAFAKISVATAEKLCKEHISAQTPAPKSVKVDKESTRATNASFSYTFKVKNADDSNGKLKCTVDRTTETVSGVATAE
jgi:hypothetical protein